MRVVDHDVRPGVKSKMGESDAWPAIHASLLRSDIVVIATPTWVAQPPSVAKRVLEQRDAPGELRHRLRSTLAMIRTIIRSSARTGRDPDAFVAHLEDWIDALARSQSTADEHGEIKLLKLLADELFHYG